MGNLIKDFWTYRYKKKKYFGIVEVIKGNDLGQNRSNKKYETHIQKALKYTMNNDVLSHMSIQTFSSWLKHRTIREDEEQRYYPFVIEFEPKLENNTTYIDAVFEANKYVQYLNTELMINREDILIMINNSKSIYVFTNPKSYAAKPETRLNEIYYEMYSKIKKKLGLKNVDESIVNSKYKVMKTPNSLYKGGYFVRISHEELIKLHLGSVSKEQLTKTKRSLDIEVPSQISLKASRAFNAAKKKILYGKIDETDSSDSLENPCGGKCVQYLLTHMIEKGDRNFGLVSVGIYLKSLGYTEQETIKNLIELGESWKHDESERKIISKVNTIYRRNYNFSCKYVKGYLENMGIENICSKCPFAKKAAGNKTGIDIDSAVINDLWKKKGSTRHYLMYLEFVNRDLFNKNINIQEENINERTLRELCKLAGFTRHKVEGVNCVFRIEYKPKENTYTLTKEFIEQSAFTLGESLKHYLKLLTKGYKATEKYIMIRASKDNLMKELKYENVSSLYKLFNKLSALGLIKLHKKSVYTLYYKSFKITELYQEVSEENQLKVAVGEQITLEHVMGSKKFEANEDRSSSSSSSKLEDNEHKYANSSSSRFEDNEDVETDNTSGYIKRSNIEDIKRNIQQIIIGGNLQYRIDKDVIIDEHLENYIKENIDIIQKYKRLYIASGSGIGRYYLKYKPLDLEDLIDELRSLNLTREFIIINAKKYGYIDQIFYILEKVFGTKFEPE